jgi:hypothetical protein
LAVSRGFTSTALGFGGMALWYARRIIAIRGLTRMRFSLGHAV